MIKFDNDENLGKMIAKKQLYTFGAAPITQFKELVFAAGGNKFSSLCGFRFTTNEEVEHKDFFIAFVCKLRSKIYRQAQANPSQWFIFKKISGKEMHCMDKKTILIQYNFDVDKFFDSDYFQNTLPKFKAKIEKGLKTYVPEYVKAHGAEKAKDLLTSYDGDNENTTVQDAYKRYTDAIDLSLEHIDSIRCNDKFYKLIDYDIKVEKEETVKEKLSPKADSSVWIDDFVNSTNPRFDGKSKEERTKMALAAYYAAQKNVNEDDLVSEDTCECIVKPEKDGGFSVFQKNDNMWIATFSNEVAASDFASNYPKMKDKYTKATQETETKEKMVEKEVTPSDKEVAEKELDDKIEEALKEVYK